MGRRVSITLCAVAASLALATSARAGTVSVSDGTLRYVAAPGEANSIGVFLSNPGVISLDEIDVPIVAAQGCTQRSETYVDCDQTGVTRIELDLGDMDDVERLLWVGSIPASV